MLRTLRIKNLALVSDLTIEFQPGLNVITGETGAGKSVLIGALSLVLGERADRNLIRSGADSCAVEALFDAQSIPERLGTFLDEHGLEPCENGELVLKRSFTSAGANRQFINGSPTTLSAMAQIGEWLVDIHGPHDHQSLLHPARQLDILDAFGALHEQRRHFATLLHQRKSLQAEKASLIVDEKTYAQQLDLLRFQVNEISAGRLQPGEEAKVEQEHQRATNAARLLELGQVALDIVEGDEHSVLERSRHLGRVLNDLTRIDSGSHALAEIHARSLETFSELQSQLSGYLEKLETDPERLHQLEERLNILHALRRKYGSTVVEVIAFGQQAERKLAALEQRDTELARIQAQLEKVQAELRRAGDTLTALRRKLVPQLSRAVIKELNLLGFKQSAFDIALSSNPDGASNPANAGFDSIDFQFAPNPGEPLRPLRTIASSGEMARVMLALKTVLAGVDEIPVLVFDEVDANVAGESAHAVGEKMAQIGRKRQVICITHLPQVAAHGTTHFVVTKHVKGGRTYSEINLLSKAQRIPELARMLGGQTEAATRHAETLLAD